MQYIAIYIRVCVYEHYVRRETSGDVWDICQKKQISIDLQSNAVNQSQRVRWAWQNMAKHLLKKIFLANLKIHDFSRSSGAKEFSSTNAETTHVQDNLVQTTL